MSTDSTSIKAIETRYAGCHFRSRLEARWAVFFDALGIRWEYEPQGFELPTWRYLPDFWLPQSEVWIEVKGHNPNQSDITKLCELAAEVCRQRQRCRMLGPIPRRTSSFSELIDGSAGWDGIPCFVPEPDYIVMNQTDADIAAGVTPPRMNDDGSIEIDMASNYGIPAEHWSFIRTIWIPGHTKDHIQAGIDAARSARFEYGHSGAS